MDDVPLYRLYLLRAYYAFTGIGSAVIFWPSLVTHQPAWGIEHGAQYSLLGALSPMFLLGLRYPLKMLPMVLYEFLWKLLWFIFVAEPLWVAGNMNDEVWSNVFACAIAVVLTPLVVPWRHLWRVYVTEPANRWS